MDLPSAYTKETYDQVIAISKKYGIDHQIIDAFITIESSWNPMAVRYEPNWHYETMADKYAALNHITEDTEGRLQMFSYGLMQIMGGTARTFKYSGNLLALTNIAINIDLGCQIITKLMKRYSELSDVAAAYNAGSVRKGADGNYTNQQYVNKFNSAYQTIVSSAE